MSNQLLWALFQFSITWVIGFAPPYILQIKTSYVKLPQLEQQLWIPKHRRLWSSNEDTSRKSVEGDETPISQGLFASVILKKRGKKHSLWTFMEEFGTEELHRKDAAEEGGGEEMKKRKKMSQAEIRQHGLFWHLMSNTLAISVAHWEAVALRGSMGTEKKRSDEKMKRATVKEDREGDIIIIETQTALII